MDDVRAPIKWGQKVEEVETKCSKKRTDSFFLRVWLQLHAQFETREIVFVFNCVASIALWDVSNVQLLLETGSTQLRFLDTASVCDHISTGHKMIMWSCFPRVSSSSSLFFFYAFHQTAGRAEAGLLAPRAPCHPLSLKGNLPIILFTSIHLSSIRQLQTSGRESPTHFDPPTDRLAALYPFHHLLFSLLLDQHRRRTILWTFRPCCSFSDASRFA